MATDPFTLIAFYESGFNPTAQNPQSTASGLFQMVNGTWSQALALCGCGTTGQFANEASAPASIQFAAEAALLNAHGFSDYTCAGCSPALTAAIAADGGAAAFNLGNLSINPADYANLDTQAGLTAYFQGNGGTVVAGTGVGNFPTLATPGAAVVGVTEGYNSYSYIWNSWQTGVAGTLQDMQQKIQTNVYGTIGNLIILDIALLGVLMIYGASAQTFWSKMFRAAIVITLLSANVNYYANYIVAFFAGFADTVGGWLGLTVPGAVAFDQIVNLFSVKANKMLASTPWFTGAWWWAALQLSLASAVILIAVTVAFLVWWLSQAALEVLFIFGALLALTLLFDYLRGLWDAFIFTCFHLALTAVSAVILAALTLNLMINAMQAAPSDTVAAAGGLLRAAIDVFGLCAVVSVMPFIFSYLCRGAVGASSIWRHSGATAVAAAPSAAAGAAAGAAGGAAGAMARATRPAGSSLSRA